MGHGDVPDDMNTSGWVGAFYTDEAKTWNTVARSLKIKSNVISYQCSHQKTVFAIDMKRKPRGLSKKRGSENRSSLAQSQAVPSKKNKPKKVKGKFAEDRNVLEERVKQWTLRAELLRVRRISFVTPGFF